MGPIWKTPMKKHSADSPITQLANEIHLRLAREYGHPVDFVLAAVDRDRPYWVDLATNAQDGPLFNRMLSAIKNDSPSMDSSAFVVPKEGNA